MAKRNVAAAIGMFVVMVPIVAVIFPIVIDLLADVSAASMGPGPEAIYAIMPNIMWITVVGFVVAIIVARY